MSPVLPAAAASKRLGCTLSRHGRAKAPEPKWGVPRQSVLPHDSICAPLTLMCTKPLTPDWLCRYSHGINLPCEWGRAVPCNGHAHTARGRLAMQCCIEDSAHASR